MARAIGLVCVLALAGVLLLLPATPRGELAALEAPELLAAPRADGTTLWQGLVERELVRGADGRATLPLAGVELVVDGAPDTRASALELARRSLARGFRAQAAAQGLSLAVPGERLDEPAPAEGARLRIAVEEGKLALEDRSAGRALRVEEDWRPPSSASLWPPFVAIALAILLRRPVLALAAGVITGGFLQALGAGHALPAALALAPLRGLGDHVLPQLWTDGGPNVGRLEVLGFVACLLAMVGVVTKSGGLRGMMDAVAKLAGSARSTQIATWVMGIVVFFDDYANCVLVGSTMRPLTDRFRVAREKLAYLVDSTAAPVAGLSLFSTWIAYEVSTFSAQLPAAGLLTSDGYAVFVQTLPYRFYCILTLVLAGAIAFSGRDWGPMLTAERRARTTGAVVRPGGRPLVSAEATAMEPAEGVRPSAARALVPVLVFLGLTVEEILRVGLGAMRAVQPGFGAAELLTLEGITGVLGDGDSTRALQVGSAAGLVVAALMALAAGLRGEIVRAAWTSLRAMGVAILILLFAWSIGSACESLGTAPYLTVLLGERLDPPMLPAILFLLSALIALSTGSSWSTMSILLPLVVGLAYHLGESSSLGGLGLMVLSIGSVLEGSIFGDHCSPLSDTTVLSSTASASDHVDHVRTQLPYALATMGTALVCGYLPCAYLDLSPWFALALGAAVLLGALFLLGKRADDAVEAERG